MAPRSWAQGHEYVHDGIGDFADAIVTDFTNDFQLASVGVIFQAGVSAQTCHIPTERLNEAFKEPHAYARRILNNAWKFTNRVETDLVRINNATKAIVVSVGLDGFACHAPNLISFLKRNKPFTLVIRETELAFGMEERFFPTLRANKTA